MRALTGLWSIQAKLEGIVPRATWHWSKISTVINVHLGVPGRTPLNVDLPSAWGSFDGELVFSHFIVRVLFVGTLADRRE